MGITISRVLMLAFFFDALMLHILDGNSVHVAEVFKKKAGMRIRFWAKNQIRGSVPQTKGDF